MKTQGDSLRDDMEDAVQKAGSATGCTVSTLPCRCASQLDAQYPSLQVCLIAGCTVSTLPCRCAPQLDAQLAPFPAGVPHS